MDFFNNRYKNNKYYRITRDKKADGQDHSDHSSPHSHRMMTVTAPLFKLLTWRTHDGTYNAPTVCGRSCFLLGWKENVEEERKGTRGNVTHAPIRSAQQMTATRWPLSEVTNRSNTELWSFLKKNNISIFLDRCSLTLFITFFCKLTKQALMWNNCS